MKIIRVLLIGLFCLLFLGQALLASENSTQILQKEKAPLDSAAIRIQNVKALAIGRFGDRIKFDKYGIPIEITGNLSKGLTGTDVVEKAYQFFEINKDIFQIDQPRQELVIGEVIKEATSTVKFYWVLNGVKVQYGGYFLQFSRDGSLYNVEGQVDPEARSINTKPSISEEQAKQIAINDSLNAGKPAEIKEMELLIGRFKGEIKLAWTFYLTNSLSWHYAIDAHTGEILVHAPGFRK